MIIDVQSKMAKRPLQPFGLATSASKVPKLEVTISDHNFPLSQNYHSKAAGTVVQENVWGDDNEDDLLLQASQACEQSDTNNITTLPDYNMWKQQPSTSTQYPDYKNNTQATGINGTPKGKNSLSLKNKSEFKRPAVVTVKENTPSGMMVNNVEDSFVMDNMNKEHFYERFLQVQEENAKLKSENSKLLEKALCKDGEVTILRGKLKSSLASVDAARLERLQASERLQVEWSEKMTAVNKEVGSLKTQLDCKELEIVRVRERCRMLESNKIKLTQMNSSQMAIEHISQKANNMTMRGPNSAFYTNSKMNKVTTTSVQTEESDKSVKLNGMYKPAPNDLSKILPLLLETEVKHPNLFQDLTNRAQTKRRIDQSSSVERKRERVDLSGLREDMSALAAVEDLNVLDTVTAEKSWSILTRVKSFLQCALDELKLAAEHVTSAFQRDLDDKYTHEIKSMNIVNMDLLFSGRLLFREEQEIDTRRAVSALAAACGRCRRLREAVRRDDVLDAMTAITGLIDAVGCAVQYTGLLLSFLNLMQTILSNDIDNILFARLSHLTIDIVSSRPCLVVVYRSLELLSRLSVRRCGLDRFCTDSASGNLKMDYDQGLVLFKKESCFLQRLLLHLESCVKSAATTNLSSAVSVARYLLSLYVNADQLGMPWCTLSNEHKCRCPTKLAQVTVYALQLCARALHSGAIDLREDTRLRDELLSLCRRGVFVIYLWTLREYDLRLLDYYSGYCHVFLDLCDAMRETVCIDEILSQTLTELLATLQPGAEDAELPTSAATQVWIDSFSRFHITD